MICYGVIQHDFIIKTIASGQVLRVIANITYFNNHATLKVYPFNFDI